MIKSMTGFGRAEVITKERKITVELKSVNHRYLDLSIKMPRKLVFLAAYRASAVPMGCSGRGSKVRSCPWELVPGFCT